MTDREIDPAIADFVHQTENRFGAQGLEDLIALAQEELVRARAALKGLEDLGG